MEEQYLKVNNKVIQNIWKDRYRKNNETVDGNLHRVAKFCSKDKYEEEEFYEVFSNEMYNNEFEEL